MSALEPRSTCEIATISDDEMFRAFINSNPSDLAIIDKPYGPNQVKALPSGTADFVKWLKQTQPELTIQVPQTEQYILRQSIDLWLPTVQLAKNLALPIFLNIVSCYLYDKMKTLLNGESVRAHLEVEYEDQKTGVTKRFKFSGDKVALDAAIKKFNLNKFLDE